MASKKQRAKAKAKAKAEAEAEAKANQAICCRISGGLARAEFWQQVA